MVLFSDVLDDFSLRFRVEAAPNAPKEPIAKSPAVEEGSGTIWLFSTLCDNFCLCKVKCLLGKTFRTILKEETISIDLVYTQKPEEPQFV